MGEGSNSSNKPGVGLSERAGIRHLLQASTRMPGVCLVSGRSENQPLMIHPGPSCQQSLS